MRWLVCLVLVAGCYRPETRDCTLQCSAPTDCAGEQVCSSGWCANDGVRCTEDGQPVTVDAAVSMNQPDAPNANQLCQQGCSNGTCMNGVCVIDCAANGSCQGEVSCPANLPCRVLCGDNACAKKIQCMDSKSCEVRCMGSQSCGEEVVCPSGECDVTCSGVGSCKKKSKCGESCACDITCTGLGSCPEASECPSSACRIGNGCSSTPNGCNTCS